MGILESPGRICADQRAALLVRPSAGEYALADGQRAGSPLAEAINMRAAQFGIHVRMERVPPGKHGHLAVDRQRAVNAEHNSVERLVFEPVGAPWTPATRDGAEEKQNHVQQV